MVYLWYNKNMSDILIIGNVMKDVYLKLDERDNNFEQDEAGVFWLDLPFDQSAHHFYHRTSVWSGAAVSLEVLENLGQSAEIVGSKLKFDMPEEEKTGTCNCYRYILCTEKGLTYFVPNDRPATIWEAPSGDLVKWIYVDHSAVMTPELARRIEAYLALSGQTRLAIFLDTRQTLTAGERRLAEFANLIFTNGDISDIKKQGLVCEIGTNYIRIQDRKRTFRAPKEGLATNLTISLTAAATVLGALLRGENTESALDLVKANVENSPLASSLNYEQLNEEVEERMEESNPTLIAQSLMAPGKGILAADESDASIAHKFGLFNIDNSFEMRRSYREMLLTAPSADKYMSGVILFDETTKQSLSNGVNFVDYLTSHGIIPGIKVDQGLREFGLDEIGDSKALEGEKWTSGLEGLEDRLAKYYEMGLRFAKWRAAFEIHYTSEGKMIVPSDYAIQRNAEILAHYALACQAAGLVPIVEPEVIHDGHYGIDACAIATSRVLDGVFAALEDAEVDLSACILKCNMIIAGSEWPEQTTPEVVGEWTARILREHVPANLAGVVFLSGGQDVEQSTDNLKAVCANGEFPWPLTFSFGRALQDPAAKAWGGKDTNKETAQAALLERLEANAKALNS